MGCVKGSVCRTPGTVYETKVTPDCVTFKVKLPRQMLATIGSVQERDIAKSIHDRVLPLIEDLYRQFWRAHFARQEVDGTIMPEKWEML